ncbi:OmpA family protein [candidate division KSB1 bacterium]|nr:OmpA family protein [candidate division KSB1 bacterium]
MEIEKEVPAILKGIEFKSGSFELTPESTETLGDLYDVLRKNPDIVIEIRGYTDDVGEAVANLRLSQHRADAVRNFLILRGIASAQSDAAKLIPLHPMPRQKGANKTAGLNSFASNKERNPCKSICRDFLNRFRQRCPPFNTAEVEGLVLCFINKVTKLKILDRITGWTR